MPYTRAHSLRNLWGGYCIIEGHHNEWKIPQYNDVIYNPGLYIALVLYIRKKEIEH